MTVKKTTTDDINGLVLNIVDINDPFIPLEIVTLGGQVFNKEIKYKLTKGMEDISIVLVNYDLTHSLEII